MIAIVAPEPAPWIRRMVALAAAVDRVELIAPWALPDRAALRAAAGRIGFVRRRLAPPRPQPGPLPGRRPDVRVAALPGFSLAELGLGAWIGTRTDRRLRALFWRRAAVDRLAAAALARRRDLRAVIAPSGGAERAFAAAAGRGARCILVEDLPGLRQLHEDLDRAAAAHPGCRFLRRFRAGAGAIARQEVEWALADRLLVRGRFARAVRAAAGVPAQAILDAPDPLPAPPDPGARRAGGPRRPRALAAGLAVARHGTVELCALLEARPDLELVIRPGEGLEPAELLAHPRVSRATAGEIDSLTGIDVVLAPAWCEVYPAELGRAIAARVPFVATGRAAGFARLTGPELEPGDVGALAAAVEIALAFGAAPVEEEQVRWRRRERDASSELRALLAAPASERSRSGWQDDLAPASHSA